MPWNTQPSSRLPRFGLQIPQQSLDLWRTVERRQRNSEDLGDVFDEGGVWIGRFTVRDGSLVRWVEVEAET
jgi:hypothetical protein